MPNVVVIAGPNGAGKSTLAPNLLEKHFGNVPFVNADEIAETLVGSEHSTDIQAGRVMLRRLMEYGSRNESFAFETTLAGRSYLRFLAGLLGKGFTFQVVYLWLPSVELSIQRVAERVRSGGHDVPVSTIRRRFDRGRKNFLELYMPAADAWRLYDASDDEPRLIASGDRIHGELIVEKEVWRQIRK
jgi:predicted ABC-type ATPase